MSCQKDNAEAIRRNGYRLTPQRSMILSAVKHLGGHVTASDICRHIEEESYVTIDVSTIYRTLGLLKDTGLVANIDLGKNYGFYEWIGEDTHHHLVCRHCKSVTLIDEDFLKTVAAKITETSGFKPSLDHLAILGACFNCWQDTR